MPKVSIITPAYNASKYIEETIDSVMKQTDSDWEMVIVDDCSDDDTYAIAKRCAEEESRIRVFRNEENSGVAYTRNRALDEARGKYVAFLDADDLWLPNKIEKQVQFMENGGFVLSYTDYQRFDSITGERKKRIIRAPAKMTARRIYGDTSIGCLTVMVNRDISGPFHMPLLNHTEDNITWQTILSRGYVGYRLGEVLSLYREGNSSLTSGKKKAAIQQWKTYREYYKFSIAKSAFYFVQYAFHAVLNHL